MSSRFVVYGTGAVGGAIAGKLCDHGADVVAIARGAQREAIARQGLRLVSPEGESVVRVAVVGGPAEIDWRADDLVVLAVKSQDTAAALEHLYAVAPAEVAVLCAQNGVANEREALRRFQHTYGVCVQMPSTFLEPGRIVLHSAPLTGTLDVGCYPGGADDRAAMLAATFAASGFVSTARDDIMRWKYAKLVRNAHNAVRALIGPPEAPRELDELLGQESHAILAAAAIDYVGAEEYEAYYAATLTPRSVAGHASTLGSSWQSLARGSGSIEADYLNGELVLLGRLHGVPTPVNDLVRRVAIDAARRKSPPGTLNEAELLAMLR